jgi:hypothetical protein
MLYVAYSGSISTLIDSQGKSRICRPILVNTVMKCEVPQKQEISWTWAMFTELNNKWC